MKIFAGTTHLKIRREMLSRQRHHKSGSSLLVALLVMGILMTLTLGLSSLVVGEIRRTSDLVASGQAYFAAEAGIEQALAELSQRLPGYETTDMNGEVAWVPIETDAISYRYRIGNKGDAIPFFPEDEPVFLTEDQGAVTPAFLYSDLPSETYNVLGLHESVTIPLFTDNGDGTFDNVTEFLVQYYVDFELDEQATLLQSGLVNLEDFDILRWKVFGNPFEDPNKTDAISDFYPALTGDSPTNPVCIGSGKASSLLNGDNYVCSFPVAKTFGVDASGQATGEITQEVLQDLVWSQARECYLSEAGAQVATSTGGVHRGCSIQTFIDTHQRNYITLTNIVNPDIVGISNIDLRAARANIYYRVLAVKGSRNLVRGATDISADGFARDGQVRQSIDVQLEMSSFLPVFNFSLYRTDTQSDKDGPGGSAPGPNASLIKNISL